MAEIFLDGQKVVKMEFHQVEEFLWIRFELEDGTKVDSYYLKGCV